MNYFVIATNFPRYSALMPWVASCFCLLFKENHILGEKGAYHHKWQDHLCKFKLLRRMKIAFQLKWLEFVFLYFLLVFDSYKIWITVKYDYCGWGINKILESVSYTFNCLFLRLERWIDSSEYLLLLQRALIQFPAPVLVGWQTFAAPTSGSWYLLVPEGNVLTCTNLHTDKHIYT